MIYAHVNMGEVSSCTKNTEETFEPKEPGIYERTRETREILREVLVILDTFKNEIRNCNIPENERTLEPTCFRDEVAYVNELAFAIKHDLSHLINEFH